MNNQQIIHTLFHYGHFNNPIHPTGVREEDLAVLTLGDDVVQIAIKSYQDFFQDQLNAHTIRSHGRLAVPDGHLGPATLALIMSPRCGMPDFAPMGSGSWPKGCYDAYKENHAITVRIDKARMPGFLEPVFEEVWNMVVTAYADMGALLLRNDGSSKANIHFSFESLRGSTIGLAIVPRGPQCGDSIWCKYDYGYNPSDTKNQWARLIAHELGHNMGMSHSRGGIMNPSIISGPFTPTAWRGDPSEALMTRYFDGKPINPGPGPEPEPDPDNPYWFRGHFTLMHGDKPVGDYILTPKPKV